MATKLSITSGQLIAELNYDNDEVAQATLLLFYEAKHMGELSATPKQKGEAILHWLARYMRRVAMQYHVEKNRVADTEEAKSLYNLGGIEPEEGI